MRVVDEFRPLHTDDILSMSLVMNILATGERWVASLVTDLSSVGLS